MHPIAFISKAFTKEQLRWSTPEKEAYAIFYAIKKFDYILRGVHFLLRADHKNLTFINLENSGKVRRWKIEIQEYDFEVEHVPGKNNVVADVFSRFYPSELNLHHANLWELQDLNATTEIDINIPSSEKAEIRKVHNSNAGHFGVDRTMQKLIQKGLKWPYMRLHVVQFIKKCPCCQKMSYLKTPIHTYRFTTSTYNIMERIAIDTVGEFPIDEFGYKYVIVIIDCFSRFLELFPVKDLTAASAAYCLLQWVGRYGCPSTMLSDNGTQYVNQVIEEFLYLIGSHHDFIMAYSKEENGIVERANKEVLRHLRAILFDKHVITNFSLFLPLVQRIFNADTKEALGVSPAQILFGNAITLDRGIILPHKTNEQTPMPLSTWTSQMLLAQESIIKLAVTNQFKRNEKHNQEISEDITHFPINSYVLVDYEVKPPSKLHTNREGPFRVVHISNNGHKYTLKSLITDELIERHVTRLHPFHYEKDETDPRLIANKDQQLIDVEQILEHVGEKSGPKGELYFRVRWKGLTEREDTWLPCRDLLHNTILHAYLREHKMGSLIPRSKKTSSKIGVETILPPQNEDTNMTNVQIHVASNKRNNRQYKERSSKKQKK